MSTHTPMGSEGRVLFASENVAYDAGEGSVWAPLGQNASTEALEEAIAEAVKQAKSGEARPVPVTFCYPTDPYDENSEPNATQTDPLGFAEHETLRSPQIE